jgi:hypothetical protein
MAAAGGEIRSYITAPDCVLCRTNGRIIDTIVDAFERGIRVCSTVKPKELSRYLLGAWDLYSKGSSTHEEFAAFDSWDQLIAYSEGREVVDREGRRSRRAGEYDTIIGLVSHYRGRIPDLAALIEANVSDFDPYAVGGTDRLCVSSVHRAKGLEWDRVQLEDDLFEVMLDREDQEENQEDWNVLYVAATRAKKALGYGRLIEVLEKAEKRLSQAGPTQTEPPIEQPDHQSAEGVTNQYPGWPADYGMGRAGIQLVP